MLLYVVLYCFTPPWKNGLSEWWSLNSSINQSINQTLKLFIRAERTGDWNLHLISVGKMINLFAATGHINYAKSSRRYLQLMYQLPTDHPWLYHCFIEQGFHAVRLSSRYWAGLWTDLIIEQVMI